MRIAHFEGGVDAEAGIRAQPAQGAGRIEVGDAAVVLHSGSLAVAPAKSGPYALDFLRDGRASPAARPRAAAMRVDRDTQLPYMFERLDLLVGTTVYGLGERFSPFVRNGQSVDIWNEDGGTQTEQAYKNIPFFLTNRGLGRCWSTRPGRVSFEIASTKVTKAQFSVSGEASNISSSTGRRPRTCCRAIPA